MHGTANWYRNKGCRCNPCRKAWSEYNVERRRKKKAGTYEHGTYNGYKNYGCRCDDCKLAGNSYDASASKARKNRPPQPLEQICECCGKPCKLQWDHDHETLNHRGWLCVSCNTGIGKLGDNIEGLERAIAYLRKVNT